MNVDDVTVDVGTVSVGKETQLHRLSRWLLLSGLFLKQFYLLPSGSFQLGDAVIMLAFLCELINLGGNAKLFRIDFPLALFVLFEILINCIWFIVTESNTFFVPIAYYLFNFLVVLCARDHVDSDEFLRGLAYMFRLALIVQLMVYVFDFGRWYDSARYKGTFNDPNQFAFYVMSAFLTIKIIGRKGYIRLHPIEDIIVIYLVIQSASTGMLLGVSLYYLFSFLLLQRQALIKVPVLLLLAIAVSLAAPRLKAGESLFFKTGFQPVDFALTRINEKVEKFKRYDTASGGLLADRNMRRVAQRPEFFLFGSGESMIGHVGERGEIHSTPVALAYYYGLIPFSLVVGWVLANYYQGSSTIELPAYLALLLESLLLAHQRQPILWMLIVLSSAKCYEKRDINRVILIDSPSTP